MSDAKWNGEGLPPVGSEVDSLEGVALIKGYYGSQVWYQRQSGGDVVQMIEKAGFRPIRSEEGRAVEEIADILRDTNIGLVGPHQLALARALYRAGYRKQ
ncbi:MAG: hypothetical protein U9Q35_01120 [Pseudomonadota bacterium]|nr:hypothetical protein [Pseudomonadota bacterium]